MNGFPADQADRRDLLTRLERRHAIGVAAGSDGQRGFLERRIADLKRVIAEGDSAVTLTTPGGEIPPLVESGVVNGAAGDVVRDPAVSGFPRPDTAVLEADGTHGSPRRTWGMS